MNVDSGLSEREERKKARERKEACRMERSTMSITRYASNADQWKIVGKRIKVAAALSPTPVSEALQCCASLFLLISSMLETREISNENRSYIEHLGSRAESISSIIEQHATSLNDETRFKAFTKRFHDIVTETLNCVQQVRERGSVSQFMHARQDKASCRKHTEALNELHLDFIAYLSHERDSRGPHQLIKHPQLKNFWKYRMRDVHEVRWEHFWRHFLDEYPVLKLNYFRDAKARSKFETMSKEGHLELVSPWGINNILNSVENMDFGSLLLQDEVQAEETPTVSQVEDLSDQGSILCTFTTTNEYAESKINMRIEPEEINQFSLKAIYGWDIFS